MGVFFVSVFFYSQHSFANSCEPEGLSPAESATVKWIYDGDTLLLTDKRKVRLIGIDTPEVEHHQQKQQAYAAKAREALRELLKKNHYKVKLRYGAERKDRYSRTLAHVYTPDGINIESWLLEKGYARTLVFPPNIKLADCYKQSEKLAQQQSLGIWNLKNNQLKIADSLPGLVKGWVRLKGKIKKIIRHKKSIIMELDSNTKSHIQLKITKKHFKYFKKLNIDKLWDRRIIVSGFLSNKRNKRRINLKHPSQLHIIPASHLKPFLKWSVNDEN